MCVARTTHIATHITTRYRGLYRKQVPVGLEAAPNVVRWRERSAVRQLLEQGSCGAETRRVLQRVSTKGQLLALRREAPALLNPSLSPATHAAVMMETRLPAGQVAAADSGTGAQEQLVIIGNTHLHYHPLCSHIRAIQVGQPFHIIKTDPLLLFINYDIKTLSPTL